MVGWIMTLSVAQADFLFLRRRWSREKKERNDFAPGLQNIGGRNSAANIKCFEVGSDNILGCQEP
jgi:hypothetical protein